MKKFLFATLVASFAFFNVNAQDETSYGFTEGDVYVSGSAAYNTQKVFEDKTSFFSFMPRVGFFLSDNVVLGGQVGYGFSKSESNDMDIQKINRFNVGAFGRYYNKPANQFSLFGQLSVDYLSAKDDLTDISYNGFNITIAPGLSYFVSEHFALEATLGLLSFETRKDDTDDAEAVNSINSGLNFNDIGIGVVYKF